LPAFDLSTLTDRQVEVLCMRLRADLSFREIGRLLGIDHKAVIGHYQRALWKVRQSPAKPKE